MAQLYICYNFFFFFFTIIRRDFLRCWRKVPSALFWGVLVRLFTFSSGWNCIQMWSKLQEWGNGTMRDRVITDTLHDAQSKHDPAVTPVQAGPRGGSRRSIRPVQISQAWPALFQTQSVSQRRSVTMVCGYDVGTTPKQGPPSPERVNPHTGTYVSARQTGGKTSQAQKCFVIFFS